MRSISFALLADGAGYPFYKASIKELSNIKSRSIYTLVGVLLLLQSRNPSVSGTPISRHFSFMLNPCHHHQQLWSHTIIPAAAHQRLHLPQPLPPFTPFPIPFSSPSPWTERCGPMLERKTFEWFQFLMWKLKKWKREKTDIVRVHRHLRMCRHTHTHMFVHNFLLFFLRSTKAEVHIVCAYLFRQRNKKKNSRR